MRLLCFSFFLRFGFKERGGGGDGFFCLVVLCLGTYLFMLCMIFTLSLFYDYYDSPFSYYLFIGGYQE